MARVEHYQILDQGVAAWNEWRATHAHVSPVLTWIELPDHNFLEVNFNDTQLAGANLCESIFDNATARGADFSGANLEYACFDGANLQQASFRGAKLQGASFKNADLSECDFRGADLTDVDFTEAEVRAANLSCAVLNNIKCDGAVFGEAILSQAQLLQSHIVNADFSEAWFDETEMSQVTFVKCILSNSFKLESVVHMEPSTMCIETLFNGCEQIPVEFLTQMGVPEQYMSALSAIVGSSEESENVTTPEVGVAGFAVQEALPEPTIERNESTVVDSKTGEVDGFFADNEELLTSGGARASPEQRH